MPLAVTHVLLTIILVDLYRDYVLKKKKLFTLHIVLIAGIASLLPDIDLVISGVLSKLGYMTDIFYHGGITHTPFFGLLFIIPGYYYARHGRHKDSLGMYVIAFAIIFHVFLDYLLGGGGAGTMVFWPFSTNIYAIHLLAAVDAPLPIALDAIILILWLWHEETKHKISDFI
jgi:hypothetical protein